MYDETSVFLCNTFKAAGVCTDRSSCCARFNPRNPKTCRHVWKACSVSTIAKITPFIITGKNLKSRNHCRNFWRSLNKSCTTKHVCQEKHTNLRLQLSNKCSLQMSFFVIYCTQDIFINSPILLAMIVLFPLSCMTYILLWKWDHSEQIMPAREKNSLKFWGLKTTNTSSLLKKKNILFFDKYDLLQDAAATSALKKEHSFFFQGSKTNGFSWKHDPIL